MPGIRTARRLSLAAVGAAIVGCGGSAASSGPGTAAAPISPARAHAQLVGFARAVNLRAQDVPGFTVSKREHRRTHNAAFENSSQYRGCLSAAKEVKPLVKLSSREFKAGTGLHSEQLSSTVTIARSRATASRELREGKKALASAKSRDCLARIFDALGRQGGAFHAGRGTVRVTVGNLRLAPVSVSAVAHGTDGGYGFTVSLDIKYIVSARGRSIAVPTSLELDVVGVLVGRAEVSLGATTLGYKPPPELQAKAFSQIVSRALVAARTYPAVTQ